MEHRQCLHSHPLGGDEVSETFVHLSQIADAPRERNTAERSASHTFSDSSRCFLALVETAAARGRRRL
ncbi:hypothetical protein [Sphaerisporangium flaviroseum]|uniref:hypothetical protein n=1 Tax=Sphaerisporangium flaviroseum TaxID=509199 RepID=UPI0031E8BD91